MKIITKIVLTIIAIIATIFTIIITVIKIKRKTCYRSIDPILSKILSNKNTSIIDYLNYNEKTFSNKFIGTIENRISHKNLFKMCKIFANNLSSLELENKYVCIVGPNSVEWICSYIGTILAGHIPVGIYPTNSITGSQHILAETGAQIIIIGSKKQFNNFLSISKTNNNVKYIILFFHC